MPCPRMELSVGTWSMSPGGGRQQGLSLNEKIFIIPVEQVIRVRTGEGGTDVL
jgi:nitrogen regulatory protein PII